MCEDYLSRNNNMKKTDLKKNYQNHNLLIYC